MKKLLGSIVLTLLSLSGFAQDLCSELNFYFTQLTVNCKNIAGRIIPAFREYATTKVITGMASGQCSGTQPYSNDFIKFFSGKYPLPAPGDSLFSHFKTSLAACLDTAGFVVQSRADLDEGDKMIKWGKTTGRQTQTVVLELKPGTDTGFIVTLELILSYL